MARFELPDLRERFQQARAVVAKLHAERRQRYEQQIAALDNAAVNRGGAMYVRNNVAMSVLGLALVQVKIYERRGMLHRVRSIDFHPTTGRREERVYWPLMEARCIAEARRRDRSSIPWLPCEYEFLHTAPQGLSAGDIARELGRSTKAVFKAAEQGPKITAQFMRESGFLSLAEIARICHRDRMVVFTWCRRFGLPSVLARDRRRYIAVRDLKKFLRAHPRVQRGMSRSVLAMFGIDPQRRAA